MDLRCIMIYNPQTICRGDYVYPGWANGIGWLIAMTAILSVPLMAIVTVVTAYRKRPEEGLLAAFNRYSAFQHSFCSSFLHTLFSPISNHKIMMVALGIFVPVFELRGGGYQGLGQRSILGIRKMGNSISV